MTFYNKRTVQIIDDMIKKDSMFAAQRILWRSRWLKAIDNMPHSQEGEPLRSKIKALAHCLEITPARVKKSMIHGSCPKSPETQELLIKLASHLGTQFAAIRLAASGHLDLYPRGWG